MKHKVARSLLPLAVVAGMLPASSQAQLRITEVYPAGSGNGTYAADWFELMNTGVSTLDLTGWTMDDNSGLFANSIALRGVTSLAPGQIAIFLEGTVDGSTDATIQSAFTTVWFGGNAPVGLTLGNYGGSGVGLGSGGDAVNIYDSGGTLMASVSFGATTTGFTFDNAAGLDGTAISQQSAIGVNGAFQSFNGAEVGSPGSVPEPTTFALAGLGLATLVAFRRRIA